MKRIATAIAIAAALFCSYFAGAQTKQPAAKYKYLVETLKPSGSYMCGIHKAADYTIRMGGLEWKEGFVLAVTAGPTRYGYVTFPLQGAYEKLSFVLGVTRGGASEPMMTHNPNNYDMTVGLAGVYADGVKVLDLKVPSNAAPEFYCIDVRGVKEVRFAIEMNEMFLGVADAVLWSAGQSPVQTQNLLTSKPVRSQLVKDIMPFKAKAPIVHPDHDNDEYQMLDHMNDPKSIKINGKQYTYGIYDLVTPGMVETKMEDAHFHLRGQYAKMSCVIGPTYTDNAKEGKAWVTVKADGKILYEEEFSASDLARRETFDINHCKVLSFEFQSSERTVAMGIVDMFVYPDGDEPEIQPEGRPATMSEADLEKLHSLPSPCRLISNIEPFAMTSDANPVLFNGMSQYVTFSMGGQKFNEGLILKGNGASILYDASPAYATFALGGEFDYLTFTTGWISKCGALKNDVLQVYCDGKLAYECRLIATCPNCLHTVALNKCNLLKIQVNGSNSMFRPAFGIADMVVYRGEPVRNDLFIHDIPECPESIDLLDLGRPYVHYVSSMKDYPEKTIHDGRTKKEFFEYNGERIYKGFILQTIEHFDMEAGITGDASTGIVSTMLASSVTIGAIGGATISAVFPFGALLALASGGTARESSCAAFNVWWQYDYVTFTVTPIVEGNSLKPQTLKIGADGEVVAEYEVHGKMRPMTVTVPIKKCGQLMFWLDCGDKTSAQYLFHDLRLGKGEVPQHAAPSVTGSISSSVVAPVEPYVIPIRSSEPEKTEWKLPERCNVQAINEFFDEFRADNIQFNKLIDACRPYYKTVAEYITAKDGTTYRKFTIESTTGEQYSISSVIERNESIISSIKSCKLALASLKLSSANATIGLSGLNQGLIEFGKQIKNTNALANEWKKRFDTLEKDIMQENANLRNLVSKGVCVDGVQSDDSKVFVR